MLIQSALYLILSILAVFFANYVHLGIIYMDMFYTYFIVTLAAFLTGSWLRNVVILMLLPLGLAAVPATIYRLIKKKNMPYFLEVTWVLWLVFILSNVLIQ